MSEPVKTHSDAPESRKALVVQLTVDELHAVVQDAVKSALKSRKEEDRLLTLEQVCEKLNVTPSWVYHNAKRHQFARKVGGHLRFSNNTLQRYIESTKFTVKGD
jgi:predicted DNA-binding transcriptional regulator AlpA